MWNWISVFTADEHGKGAGSCNSFRFLLSKSRSWFSPHKLGIKIGSFPSPQAQCPVLMTFCAKQTHRHRPASRSPDVDGGWPACRTTPDCWPGGHTAVCKPKLSLGTLGFATFVPLRGADNDARGSHPRWIYVCCKNGLHLP